MITTINIMAIVWDTILLGIFLFTLVDIIIEMYILHKRNKKVMKSKKQFHRLYRDII